MERNDFLQGSIFAKGIAPNSPQLRLMSFDSSPKEDTGLCNILMPNFKKFHFSKEEKNCLTFKIRHYIYTFQNLDVDTLEKDAAELVHKINQTRDTRLILETGGYGAFICLAALFNGGISPRKKITLYLSSVPLALFPRALAPKKGTEFPSYDITFILGQNCWFKEISSLSICPKFLNLDYKVFSTSWENEARAA